MVISKCVPLAISRKKFSQFLPISDPNNSILVGLKRIDGKQKNIQIPYSELKEDILAAIKADPEWGQGGSGGGDTPQPPVDNPEWYEPVTVNEIGAFPLSVVIEDGEIVKGKYWQQIIDNEGNVVGESTIIDLKERQGFVEINSGGDYTEDYILFSNPVKGIITNIVVDNTGLSEDIPADKEFTLYYGYKNELMDSCYPILTVPPMSRGIVQILHTTDVDIVVHSSYSYAFDAQGRNITKFVEDYKTEEQLEGELTNTPIDATPISNYNDLDVDMAEQKGYIEFDTRGHDEYTFWFSNPEIGSSTYIVINNTGGLYTQDVNINYGKKMKIEDDTDDVKYSVAVVGDERCVIEIFHSLSADIIVKVTKV